MEQPNLSYINDLSGGDESFKEKLINIIRSFPRTALHARLLSFRCNKSDEELSFEIPMPSDMENLVADIHRYI